MRVVARFFRARRLRSLSVVFLIIFSFYCVFSIFSTPNSSNIVVSLTSTAARFTEELPLTIYSLLKQKTLAKQIRIYLSKQIRNGTKENLKSFVKRIDRSRKFLNLFDRTVEIHLIDEDFGPATKFLPILHENFQSERIMICDDDHFYHSETIETLEFFSNIYSTSMIGLRGWRIRDDLTWGVSGTREISFHIIESYRVADAYRVGVLTANNAYLVRPSFFDSTLYDEFFNVTNDIRRMDDIWLNGHAAKRNISRYVVPSCCQQFGITRTHELENYLTSHQMTRATANDHALRFFGKYWEKDLWYRFNGENRPRAPHQLIQAIRQTKILIQKLFFFMQFGSF